MSTSSASLQTSPDPTPMLAGGAPARRRDALQGPAPSPAAVSADIPGNSRVMRHVRLASGEEVELSLRKASLEADPRRRVIVGGTKWSSQYVVISSLTDDSSAQQEPISASGFAPPPLGDPRLAEAMELLSKECEDGDRVYTLGEGRFCLVEQWPQPPIGRRQQTRPAATARQLPGRISEMIVPPQSRALLAAAELSPLVPPSRASWLLPAMLGMVVLVFLLGRVYVTVDCWRSRRAAQAVLSDGRIDGPLRNKKLPSRRPRDDKALRIQRAPKKCSQAAGVSGIGDLRASGQCSKRAWSLLAPVSALSAGKQMLNPTVNTAAALLMHLRDALTGGFVSLLCAWRAAVCSLGRSVGHRSSPLCVVRDLQMAQTRLSSCDGLCEGAADDCERTPANSSGHNNLHVDHNLPGNCSTTTYSRTTPILPSNENARTRSTSGDHHIDIPFDAKFNNWSPSLDDLAQCNTTVGSTDSPDGLSSNSWDKPLTYLRAALSQKSPSAAMIPSEAPMVLSGGCTPATTTLDEDEDKEEPWNDVVSPGESPTAHIRQAIAQSRGVYDGASSVRRLASRPPGMLPLWRRHPAARKGVQSNIPFLPPLVQSNDGEALSSAVAGIHTVPPHACRWAIPPDPPGRWPQHIQRPRSWGTLLMCSDTDSKNANLPPKGFSWSAPNYVPDRPLPGADKSFPREGGDAQQTPQWETEKPSLKKDLLEKRTEINNAPPGLNRCQTTEPGVPMLLGHHFGWDYSSGDTHRGLTARPVSYPQALSTNADSQPPRRWATLPAFSRLSNEAATSGDTSYSMSDNGTTSTHGLRNNLMTLMQEGLAGSVSVTDDLVDRRAPRQPRFHEAPADTSVTRYSFPGVQPCTRMVPQQLPPPPQRTPPVPPNYPPPTNPAAVPPFHMNRLTAEDNNMTDSSAPSIERLYAAAKVLQPYVVPSLSTETSLSFPASPLSLGEPPCSRGLPYTSQPQTGTGIELDLSMVSSLLAPKQYKGPFSWPAPAPSSSRDTLVSPSPKMSQGGLVNTRRWD